MKIFKGMTLVETMVAVLIFSFLFALVFSALNNSSRSWRLGQDKLAMQQQARQSMDVITRLLRQSNPDWIINTTHYPVSISSNNSRIDFYQPVFNVTGNLTALRKITFKLNPDNPQELLKKEGSGSAVSVANDIEDITFGAGCAGCAIFNCTSVANDCPVVKVAINTKEKEANFSLNSTITLRNSAVAVNDTDIEIEQPQGEEF